jgi:hypothetical protein
MTAIARLSGKSWDFGGQGVDRQDPGGQELDAQEAGELEAGRQEAEQ